MSLFLKVTIIPPRAAGLGEKERAPLLLVIEIDAGPVALGDGAVGLPELDPPPQFHALAKIRTAAATVNIRSLMSCCPFEGDGSKPLSKPNTSEKRRECAVFAPSALPAP